MVLLELGLNPNSVKANLMPMLSLPEDLKHAIRQKGLKGGHALALATISAKTWGISEKKATRERSLITSQVLQEHLTVSETRELIKRIKAKYLTPKQSDSKDVRIAIDKMKKLSTKSLSFASDEQLQQLSTLLRLKLEEVDRVLTKVK